MTDRPDTSYTRPRPLRRLERALHFAIICSFLLPFATVSSCMGPRGEGETYTGIELLSEDSGVLLIGVIVLAALLLAFSFRRLTLGPVQRGVLSAVDALLCAIAIVTTFFATGITFMFSRVSLQVGFYVCVGCWFLLEILYTRSALEQYRRALEDCTEPPPPWGLLAGAMAIVVIIATAWISKPNGAVELLVGVFVGVLLSAPITVLALLSAVFYRLRKQGVRVTSAPMADGSSTRADW